MSMRQAILRPGLLSLLLALLLLSGCAVPETGQTASDPAGSGAVSVLAPAEETEAPEQPAPPSDPQPEQPPAVFSPEDVPPYSGDPWTEVNGNVPFFSGEEQTTEEFERYSELDALGRCGAAYANICPALMPTEERGEIGMIRPSGWHLAKYDFVDGKYLYNRCHLIAFQLSGENANERNLITGTRFLNIRGMLPFENQVATYVRETGNHVLYRVTPLFSGDDLVARGVLLEGLSVEDGGAGICFCAFAYNVQPGVVIDYATGESWEDTSLPSDAEAAEGQNQPEAEFEDSPSEPEDSPGDVDGPTYILNTNTHKIHLPSCQSVGEMKEKNKAEFSGDPAALLEQGYTPCQRCLPQGLGEGDGE